MISTENVSGKPGIGHHRLRGWGAPLDAPEPGPRPSPETGAVAGGGPSSAAARGTSYRGSTTEGAGSEPDRPHRPPRGTRRRRRRERRDPSDWNRHREAPPEGKCRVDIVQQRDEGLARLDRANERADWSGANRQVAVANEQRAREHAGELRVRLIEAAGIARDELWDWPQMDRTIPREEFHRLRREG